VRCPNTLKPHTARSEGGRSGSDKRESNYSYSGRSLESESLVTTNLEKSAEAIVVMKLAKRILSEG